jgi:multisubunit Na+/H+ antiporter MnhE subunit
MPNGSDRKIYLPVLYLFLGLSALFLLLHWLLPGTAVDYRVLITGNLLLFLVGWISLRMNVKAMKHQNVQVFLRLVYSSFLLKFFVLAICAFIYIFLFKKQINKPGLFGCFGLYFIYTFLEVRSVMKQSKKTNA